jgi:hypothetical protein
MVYEIIFEVGESSLITLSWKHDLASALERARRFVEAGQAKRVRVIDRRTARDVGIFETSKAEQLLT